MNIGRLRHRIGAVITDRQLWAPDHRVAVAVSGGIDSVVLLDLLSQTAGWHRAELSVVTVDHGTRPGSAEDAQWVQDLADRLGLPCTCLSLGLGAGASEATMREARYEAFQKLDVHRVAVAHHRDDQAETVLIQLMRGTGTRGLAGMAWRNEHVVRPLLSTSRGEIEAWAAHRELSWRTDPTNLDRAFLRNRIRHDLMPILEDMRPGATEAIARSATLAALDADLLDAVVDRTPEAQAGDDGWDRRWIAGGPEALVRRAILREIPGLGASHVDAILAAARVGGGEVGLPGGSKLVVSGGRVTWA